VCAVCAVCLCVCVSVCLCAVCLCVCVGAERSTSKDFSHESKYFCASNAQRGGLHSEIRFSSQCPVKEDFSHKSDEFCASTMRAERFTPDKFLEPTRQHQGDLRSDSGTHLTAAPDRASRTNFNKSSRQFVRAERSPESFFANYRALSVHST
jgi:hypothetical protein